MKNEYETRPWLRYLARIIDTIVYGVILLFIGVFFILIEVMLFDFDVLLIDVIPDIIFSIIYVISMIFIEPLVLSYWQTTFGKTLLNIKINKLDGSRITYTDGLVRTIDVWVKGLAFGIPIIGLFTQINAYIKLKDEGITSWDKIGKFKVRHEAIEVWRIFLAIGLVVSCIILILLVS